MSTYADDLNLLELKEKAYVWVGKQFPSLLINAVKDDDDDSEPESIPMLVALNRAFDVPKQMQPFMEFFRYPRTESETNEWLEQAVDQPVELLEFLLKEHLVIQFDPNEGVMTALNALHLEPSATLLPAENADDDSSDDEKEPEPGLRMISNRTDIDIETDLTPITRDLLFGYPNETLQTVVQNTADEDHAELQDVTDELLKNLATWLRDEFAFLLYME